MNAFNRVSLAIRIMLATFCFMLGLLLANACFGVATLLVGKTYKMKFKPKEDHT